MNDNEYLVETICKLLQQKSAAILASIIVLEGSSPRHNGAKMVIGADGKSYGTIGGSLLEAMVIKEARATITQAKSKVFNFALNGQDARSAGMICGGLTSTLLDYLAPTAENLAFFQDWQKAIKAGKEFYSVTHYKNNGNTINIIGRSIVFPDGNMVTACQLSEDQKTKLRAELPHTKSTSLVTMDDSQLLIDPIRKIKTMYCFGAGHVAVPTAHLAALTGFRVVVIDDRAEYANAERFPEAQSLYVEEDYAGIIDKLEIDEDSFIVILTRGHMFDREVLEKAIKTKAGYIGMISSLRKREAIYNQLKSQGVTESELARVHSPIGIPIKVETPEEISVSIVAELIDERNKQSA